MGIKHTFVSTKNQGSDNTLVSKNEWNDDHDLTGFDILDIPTTESGGSLFLAPDGLGGVEWASGGGTPATTVESETTWGITPAVGTDTEYARQDHTHGSPAQPAAGGVGALLISDTPSTPLVFADLIQNEATDDLVYTDL